MQEADGGESRTGDAELKPVGNQRVRLDGGVCMETYSGLGEDREERKVCRVRCLADEDRGSGRDDRLCQVGRVGSN